MLKKSEMNVTGTTVAMIASVFLLVVVLMLLRPSLSEAGQFSSKTILQERDQSCIAYGKTEQGSKISDTDNDGRPDNCDICLGLGGKGNNDEDKDGDWMPDYCDNAPDDSTDRSCKKSFTTTKDGRCIEAQKIDTKLAKTGK